MSKLSSFLQEPSDFTSNISNVEKTNEFSMIHQNMRHPESHKKEKKGGG